MIGPFDFNTTRLDCNMLSTEHTYRITAVLKVETDIITNIAASPSCVASDNDVETFKTELIVFIGIKRHNDLYFPVSRIIKLIVTISLKGKMLNDDKV